MMANSKDHPRVLITGTAGFIGFHLAKLLLADGFRIQGYDGMTDYYDVSLNIAGIKCWLSMTSFLTRKVCRRQGAIR